MKTINFQIIYAKNEEVYQEGYVEIPDDITESSEWHYFTETGLEAFGMYTIHEGIITSPRGATDDQIAEVDDFKLSVQHEYCDYIDAVIYDAIEREKETYTKGDLIIKINH